MQSAAPLPHFSEEPDREDSRCAPPYRRFLIIRMLFNSACNGDMTAIRSPACRGSTAWPVGQPTPARTWPTGWGATAIPAAAGWRATPLGAWTRCWPPTCLPANPSPSRQQCWPASSRPSSVRKASPRMRRGANEGADAWGDGRPVRVFSQDESRFGWLTGRRRANAHRGDTDD